MQIAVVNDSTRVTDDECKKMVMAVQIQMDTQVAPLWDILPAAVAFFGNKDAVPPGVPILSLVDTTEEAGALGYHTESKDGAYWGIVAVNPVLDNGGGILDGGSVGVSVSSVLSHEAIELRLDETVNDWKDGPEIKEGSCYANEGCDPCQGTLYDVTLPDGSKVQVSDFVGPRYFDEMAPSNSVFSFCGSCPAPFTLAVGGYQVVRSSPGTEQQVFHAQLPPAWRMAAKLKAGRTKRRLGTPDLVV